ncbi:hypothetical protein [Novosphingobium arvoryzae]|uniref:Zinc ribbon domain-containing protein n=1 Tax=Novosphingobium arvoryzae TaxID=1256514 RepID=A0A918R7T9_9SPHN|nr:hypothetical protein [Novosphingobium arvoryzae]GGZ90264.1 hypothetical protein GCM10011617_06460 [Novosphingobium arvoryzae]
MEENYFKICPYCSEEIKLNAIKCKHCGSDLDENENLNYHNGQLNSKKNIFTRIVAFIFIAIALFLVWQIRSCSVEQTRREREIALKAEKIKRAAEADFKLAPSDQKAFLRIFDKYNEKAQGVSDRMALNALRLEGRDQIYALFGPKKLASTRPTGVPSLTVEEAFKNRNLKDLISTINSNQSMNNNIAVGIGLNNWVGTIKEKFENSVHIYIDPDNKITIQTRYFDPRDRKISSLVNMKQGQRVRFSGIDQMYEHYYFFSDSNGLENITSNVVLTEIKPF